MNVVNGRNSKNFMIQQILKGHGRLSQSEIDLINTASLKTVEMLYNLMNAKGDVVVYSKSYGDQSFLLVETKIGTIIRNTKSKSRLSMALCVGETMRRHLKRKKSGWSWKTLRITTGRFNKINDVETITPISLFSSLKFDMDIVFFHKVASVRFKTFDVEGGSVDIEQDILEKSFDSIVTRTNFSKVESKTLDEVKKIVPKLYKYLISNSIIKR